VSIRPLRHADLAALLAHLDRDRHDAMVAEPAATPPIVAMRVRASVGRPGASAQAEYQRRRAAERAAWIRNLPWRVAVALAAGVTSWVAAAQVALHLTSLLAVAVTVAVVAGLGWRLRFRPRSLM
jgi:hypothetical protein